MIPPADIEAIGPGTPLTIRIGGRHWPATARSKAGEQRIAGMAVRVIAVRLACGALLTIRPDDVVDAPPAPASQPAAPVPTAAAVKRATKTAGAATKHLRQGSLF